MNRSTLTHAAMLLAGTLLGTVSGGILEAQTRAHGQAPALAAAAAAPEAVEYKIFVPTQAAAFTAEHERELNALGQQGWRVVTPIYVGGILNNYLLSRSAPRLP